MGLVRTGAEQAVVSACFALAAGHPALALLVEQGIEAEDDLVLRRVVGRDGRSRAFVGDQPVGVGLLRRLGALLVEVQGQHEQMGLADPATHGGLLDAFGVPAGPRQAVAVAWRGWREAAAALAVAQEAVAIAARDEEWLRHAVDELATLAPRPDEEERLAAERQGLQAGERRAEAIAAALAELTPRDRRSAGPAVALRAAGRALQRLVSPQAPDADSLVGPALAALERAEEALAEAETLLTRLVAEAESDPRRLEQTEERLFALRAAARKHGVAPAELPGLLDSLATRLSAMESGAAEIGHLAAAAMTARATFVAAAARLSEARRAAADRLTRAVARELPPLRLDKARFVVGDRSAG